MKECKIKETSALSNKEDITTKAVVAKGVIKAEETSSIEEAEAVVEEVEASTAAGLRVSIPRTKVLIKYKTTWVNNHNMAITNK